MRVLVSNDDGVDAPGIHALARGLREAGLHVEGRVARLPQAREVTDHG